MSKKGVYCVFWEEKDRIRKEAGILNAKLILHAIQGVL